MQRILLILLCCAVFTSANAQHEFVISTGTTLTSMSGDDVGSGYGGFGFANGDGAFLEWSYDGSYSSGVGTSFAIEYAYYLTPYWKPYFRISSATQNVTYERAFDILTWNADYTGNGYDSFDFSILTSDIGFGVYREWNNGLSVGLGLNQVSANQVDVEERYLDIIGIGNAEFVRDNRYLVNSSFWKMEWAVKYQMGKFGIELRRRGLSDYGLTNASGSSTSDFRFDNGWSYYSEPTTIRSTSILLNYSIFINK
jgi:hypothetical protein